MILETKGRATLGKWSRAIDIRFFTIKDSIEKKDLEIEYCPTDLIGWGFLYEASAGRQIFILQESYPWRPEMNLATRNSSEIIYRGQ